MNLYEAYEVNHLDDGVWFEFVTPEGVVVASIKCRPADGDLNFAYHEAISAAVAELRKRGATLDSEEGLRVQAKIFAETVVLDWKGVKGRDNAELPFSTQAAEQVFTDLPVLFKELVFRCRDWREWRAHRVESIVGN